MSTTVMLQDGLSGYAGTRDTYLSSYAVSTNYGGQTYVMANPSNYTPLIAFAIFASEGGPVPDGATIVSATLSLFKSSNYNLSMTMNRLLRNWVENQATQNNWSTGNGWTTAGAGGSGTDIEATSNATHTNANFGTNTWASTDVTTDVAAWAGGAANYGWRFKTSSGGNDRYFYTRGYTTDASLRPTLVVEYDAGGPDPIEASSASQLRVGGSSAAAKLATCATVATVRARQTGAAAKIASCSIAGRVRMRVVGAATKLATCSTAARMRTRSATTVSPRKVATTIAHAGRLRSVGAASPMKGATAVGRYRLRGLVTFATGGTVIAYAAARLRVRGGSTATHLAIADTSARLRARGTTVSAHHAMAGTSGRLRARHACAIAHNVAVSSVSRLWVRGRVTIGIEAVFGEPQFTQTVFAPDPVHRVVPAEATRIGGPAGSSRAPRIGSST